jgi:membrane-associated phospholipid phosphatase
VLVWVGGEYIRVRRKPVLEVEREAQAVLNRIDRAARGLLLVPALVPLADKLADAVAYVLTPISCLLTVLPAERPRRRLISDALLLGRALTATGAVNQAIKFLTPRERPFALGRPQVRGKDRYGSFFSSHTSAVSAMATTTAILARDRGERAWVSWPLFALSGIVGYLRIAGDKHYLTDVLAGAAFGSAAGVLFARKLV